MSILIASADYTPDGGGIGAYANGLWRGLRSAGYQASVLAQAGSARIETADERLATVAAGGTIARNARALYGWHTALKAEVRRSNCQWLVIPTWDPVGLAATLPLLRRTLPCQIAVVLHGADVASARGRKGWLLRHVLAAADLVIANSDYTGALLARRFGVVSQTVRPGIGADDLDIPAVPRMPFAVVSVGRLVRRKGHALVMQAVALLSAEFTGLTYTIVGDGTERAGLEALAGSLKIAHRIRVLGQVDMFQKQRALASASVFAMPVIHDDADPEGFGIAYLEAGAAGLPVLATRAGGVTEAVAEGQSGLFCEPNAASVAQALRNLLNHPDWRAELGRGGRRIAEASQWSARAQDLLMALSTVQKPAFPRGSATLRFAHSGAPCQAATYVNDESSRANQTLTTPGFTASTAVGHHGSRQTQEANL